MDLNVRDLDELIFKLEVLRREHGNITTINVSVLQDPDKLPGCCCYEDRPLANHIEVIDQPLGKTLEFYV